MQSILESIFQLGISFLLLGIFRHSQLSNGFAKKSYYYTNSYPLWNWNTSTHTSICHLDKIIQVWSISFGEKEWQPDNLKFLYFPNKQTWLDTFQIPYYHHAYYWFIKIIVKSFKYYELTDLEWWDHKICCTNFQNILKLGS